MNNVSTFINNNHLQFETQQGCASSALQLLPLCPVISGYLRLSPGYLPAISRLSSHIDGFWPGYLSAISRLSSANFTNRWILTRLSLGYLPAIFGYLHISMDFDPAISGYLPAIFWLSFRYLPDFFWFCFVFSLLFSYISMKILNKVIVFCICIWMQIFGSQGVASGSGVSNGDSA